MQIADLPRPLLFVDTETTGFPRSGLAPDDPAQPYMVQFAWVKVGLLGELSEGSFIVDNDVPIPDVVVAIHGITAERATIEGIGPRIAGQFIARLITQAGTVVGHNIAFDMQILRLHAARTGTTLEARPTFCTMHAAKTPCAMVGKKWPKLGEAHQILCGTAFDGAHDALNDVRATYRVFKALEAKEARNG